MDPEDPLVAGTHPQEALDLQGRLEDLATAQAMTDEVPRHLADATPAALTPRAGDEAAMAVGVGEEGGKLCHGVTVGEAGVCNRRRAAQKCGRRACAARPRVRRLRRPPPRSAIVRLITGAGVCTMVEQ